MKRIIVPTDFTETSWNATIHALAYCSMFNAELLLVHIYDIASNDSDTNFSTIVDSLVIEEERMKTLVAKVKTIKTFVPSSVKSKCIGGDIIKSIAGILGDSGDDFLIISTQGRKGTLGKIFGSTASRLIRDIDCPILLIPKGFKFSLHTPTICTIDRGTIIQKNDLAVLEKMVQVRSSANFTMINVVTDANESKDNFSLNQFKNLNVCFDKVIGVNVPTLLEQYSRMIKSRLLVLVKRKKNFLERLFHDNVLDQLTLNANIPLLVLRAEKSSFN